MHQLGDIRFAALVFVPLGYGLRDVHTLYVATQGTEAAVLQNLPDWCRQKHYKRVDVNLEEESGARFWALAVADCYDPPIAVVRAARAEEAIDIFVDGFPYSPKIDESDLRDYMDTSGEPTCSFTDGGTPYDSDHLSLFEVRLWQALQFLEPTRPAGPQTAAPPPPPPGFPLPRRGPAPRRLDFDPEGQ